MDNRLRGVLGLLDNGKRVYQLKDGDVSRADFEYGAVLTEVLFGKLGLVDSLGPTWELVHDPRFAVLENSFVVVRKSKVGGDASMGIQRQLADGTFSNSMAAIEQYAEILGEGRHMIAVLRNLAVVDAAAELFPARTLRFNSQDPFYALTHVGPYTPGVREKLLEAVGDHMPVYTNHEDIQDITLANAAVECSPNIFEELGILSPAEKLAVMEKAATYRVYQPHNFKLWPDEELSKMLRIEYKNYFSRAGKPNPLVQTLFKLFKNDLCGLVHDYAEIANVQETVLLEDVAELYEPEKHGEETPRVSMEVENLERALTYRSELRVVAYQILNQLGLSHQLVELTDRERDQLLQVIYRSNFIDDRPGAVSQIMGFLHGIRLTDLTAEQRDEHQRVTALTECRRWISGLRSGTIQPINRYTEETVDDSPHYTPEELMVQRILNNPVAAYVFSRLHGIDQRLDMAKEQYSPTQVDPVKGERVPMYPRLHNIMETWIHNAIHPDQAAETEGVNKKERELLNEIARLAKTQAILKPVFEDPNFEWTDDVAAELLTRVEHLDPSPELAVTELPEGSDPGAVQAVPVEE